MRLEATLGRIAQQCRDPLREQLEEGGIAHDCPVYGGSSGSPLLHGRTGELVGIHTGFDFRRFQAEAVTLEAIREFLRGEGLAL